MLRLVSTRPELWSMPCGDRSRCLATPVPDVLYGDDARAPAARQQLRALKLRMIQLAHARPKQLPRRCEQLGDWVTINTPLREVYCRGWAGDTRKDMNGTRERKG